MKPQKQQKETTTYRNTDISNVQMRPRVRVKQQKETTTFFSLQETEKI
jgi:hypothetical protein